MPLSIFKEILNNTEHYLNSDNLLYKSVAEALSMSYTEIRKRAKMTQEEIAEWLFLPVRTYQSWEYGTKKPTAYMKVFVLDALDMLPKRYK